MKVSGTHMNTLRISITLAALALLASNSPAQTQPPASPNNPASAATQAPQDTNHTADAYYFFAMGHAAEDEYEITGRNDAANQAVDYYKKALALDPQLVSNYRAPGRNLRQIPAQSRGNRAKPSTPSKPIPIIPARIAC